MLDAPRRWKEVCGGANICGSALLQPARSVCVSLSFFHSNFVFSPNSITNYDDVNGRKFLRPPSYCDTVCLRRTPLLMCDPFVVANLRVELFQCHVQHPMFYLDICWRKCSRQWLLLLVKIKHSAQTWCLRHLSPVNLELFILIDELGIL